MKPTSSHDRVTSRFSRLNLPCDQIHFYGAAQNLPPRRRLLAMGRVRRRGFQRNQGGSMNNLISSAFMEILMK
jgi:hypothetical protein